MKTTTPAKGNTAAALLDVEHAARTMGDAPGVVRGHLANLDGKLESLQAEITELREHGDVEVKRIREESSAALSDYLRETQAEVAGIESQTREMLARGAAVLGIITEPTTAPD